MNGHGAPFRRVCVGREPLVAYVFVPCDGSVVDDDGDIGCNGHKNAKGQAEVATFLEPRLRALLGW